MDRSLLGAQVEQSVTRSFVHIQTLLRGSPDPDQQGLSSIAPPFPTAILSYLKIRGKCLPWLK